MDQQRLPYRDVVQSNGPIHEMIAGHSRLDLLEGADYAREWVKHELLADLTRNAIEERYVDLKDSAVSRACYALRELTQNSDWLHPKLMRVLLALKAVKALRNLDFGFENKRIANTPGFMVERVAKSDVPFQISGNSALRVPILEDTASNPRLSAELVTSFASRVKHLRKEFGITHLVFIEKEVGPVGALVLLAHLVSVTKMPACIFRESRWKLQDTQDNLNAKARPVIIYDMMVSGAGIAGVADAIKEETGAETAAAIVLRGYGEPASGLRTLKGQEIRLEALDWDTSLPSTFEPLSSCDENGDRNASDPATAQEAIMQGRSGTDESTVVPPGSYTKETLPPISPAAAKILKDVDKLARWYKEQERTQSRTVNRSRALAMPLANKGLVTMRVVPSKGTTSK